MSHHSNNSGGGLSKSGASAPPPPPRRTPQDDLAEDEDGFVMGMSESDCDVVYRRAEVAQHISQGAAAQALGITMPGMMMMPTRSPSLVYDSSGETVPQFKGSTASVEPKLHTPTGMTHRGAGVDNLHVSPHMQRAVGASPGTYGLIRHQSGSSTGMLSSDPTMGRGSPLSDGNDDYDDTIYESSPPSSEAFWSPFGPDATEEDADLPKGSIVVSDLPFAFRLERTNFMAKGENNERPSVEALLAGLRAALTATLIDELEFRNGDCVLECSFHSGNRFLSLWLRVYMPPDEESGHLCSVQQGQEKEISDASYLVEAQLREGDRLHFSSLFRDLMKTFKSQDNGMSIAGTYRYKPRAQAGAGDGLALEEASFSPSRQSLRLIAEQQQEILSAASHPASMRRALADGFVGGLDANPREISRAPVLGGSVPPQPTGRLNDESVEEFDKEAMEDLIQLTNMMRGKYLDVQTDAATAVAGLTADGNFVRSLAQPSAESVASTLCCASARLLAETKQRPSRRQASVIVANLSANLACATFMLAADHSMSSQSHYGYHQRSGFANQPRRGLVDALVGMAMGGGGDGFENAVEEEIGTRRECMRALLGLARCGVLARHDPAVKCLLERDPTGKGASDPSLMTRLGKFREVFTGQTSVSA